MRGIPCFLAAATAAAVLFLGACGAFSGSDTSPPLDADGGSPRADGAADGSETAVDAGAMTGEGGVADASDPGAIDRDGSASRFCKQMLTSTLCQDYDEQSVLGGFYLGQYSSMGTFTAMNPIPASLDVMNGYLHGHAPSPGNQAFVDSPLVAIPTYTLTIKLRTTQLAPSGAVDVAHLHTSGDDIVLRAASDSVTASHTGDSVMIMTNTTVDTEIHLTYDGTTFTIEDDQNNKSGASKVNVQLKLTGVSVGAGAPSQGGADTFIDYYMLVPL